MYMCIGLCSIDPSESSDTHRSFLAPAQLHTFGHSLLLRASYHWSMVGTWMHRSHLEACKVYWLPHTHWSVGMRASYTLTECSASSLSTFWNYFFKNKNFLRNWNNEIYWPFTAITLLLCCALASNMCLCWIGIVFNNNWFLQLVGLDLINFCEK